MAGGEYLDPVVAVLAGDSAAYTAMLAEAEARMQAFVTATSAQVAELDARIATLGAGGASEAGAAAAAAGAGAAGAGGAASAAAAEQEAAASQIAAADAAIVAAAEEAAKAETTANERIIASTVDMTAAVEAEVARLAATPVTIANAAATAATEYAAAMDKMRADTIKLVTSLEVAEAQATQATAAMGAKIDAAAASSTSSLRTSAAGVGSAVAGVATAVGVVGLAVGAVSIKMAADFESSTNRLVTSAGETHQNIGMVRDGILQMAGEVGNSAEELAKAMYTIESGGQHGADGLIVLKAAAQGAKAENADLGKVADAVTSILQDYHLEAGASALVTSKLVAAVGSGKSTFEEFTGALHSVLPVASASHISLNDILGDLASMTVHGMSADQAAQNLAHTIQHLQTTTQGQRDMLGELGISAQDLQSKLGDRGLSGTLQLIESAISEHMGPAGKVIVDTFNNSKDAAQALQQMIQAMPASVARLGKAYLDGSMDLGALTKAIKALPPEQANLAKQFLTTANRAEGFSTMLKQGQPDALAFADALKRATGDSTALNTALMLTGENAAYTNGAIKTVTDATTEADGSVKGWADVQATFNQRLAEFKDTLGAVGIKIGTALLPRLTDMLTSIDNLLSHKGNLDAFAKGVSDGLQVIINAVTAVGTGFQGLTDIMQGITSGNLDQAKKGFGELANSFKNLGANMSDVTKAGADSVQSLASNMNTIHDSMNTYEQDFRSWFTYYYPNDIKAGIPPAEAATKALNLAIEKQFLTSGYRVNGQMSMLDFSSGMRDSVGAVIDAAAGVTGDLKSAFEVFDPSPEGKKVAESFGSGVRTGRQAIDAAGQEALTALITIFAGGGLITKPEGNQTGAAFADGVASALPQVNKSAGALANGATAPFSGLPGGAYGSGVSIGSNLAAGIAAQEGHVAAAAAGLAATVRSHLPSSPAKKGPLSGRGSPDLLGRNISTMIAAGMLDGRDNVAQAMTAVLSPSAAVSVRSDAVFASSLPGRAAGAGTGGGVTINLIVNGSLIQQADLRRYLQDVFLQHEARNNSNGLSGVMF